EVGGARKRAVVARPRLALLKALLDTVEAAELSPEVVYRVHDRRLAGRRSNGTAVLERAVMGEQDVQHGARERWGEAVDPLDRAAHEVVAERYLAVQLAEVGEVDRRRLLRVGLDLADVVDQRA